MSNSHILAGTVALLCLCGGALSGCSTPTAIQLIDGRELHAVDTPEYDEESGFYEFEQIDGKLVRINKDKVLSIKAMN
ncbi:YgdI/YgdR family lipoprotein [Azomonas macrocytogenes]|uniref:Lipoprotein YgdI/YgdR-like SH3-like domain-containing protein n=1 Tax=Azomonas macrocytogenes TaxID=69962 RepID=A0A839T205_AZOMA|nr:YgdI/YgdR family lipoprotein [Azomonas macrocytogenes]MBB3101773.1 hypothetical protein [Azomonas macrocytogenes]